MVRLLLLLLHPPFPLIHALSIDHALRTHADCCSRYFLCRRLCVTVTALLPTHIFPNDLINSHFVAVVPKLCRNHHGLHSSFTRLIIHYYYIPNADLASIYREAEIMQRTVSKLKQPLTPQRNLPCVYGWMDGWMDGWIGGWMALSQASELCSQSSRSILSQSKHRNRS
jgi:hypothetical protein